MIKRYYVRTRSLKDGMKMGQAVVDRKGRVLIARGALLDEYMIDSLLKLGITGVYICEGEEDEEEEKKESLPKEVSISKKAQENIEKHMVADRAKVQLSESVKKRVAEGIQYLFRDTESADFVSTTANITQDLMKAITDNDAIAVDVGMLKVSDEYTFKHSVDVATMAMVVAKKHGMSDKEIYEIGIAGILHDVGKSKIPKKVLNKPGALTDAEFKVMRLHSQFGYQILKEKKDMSDAILNAVLQHHEKINGRGYPLKLSAEKITPYAKIITVVDIYDALVTERPYKKAYSQRDAVEIIMSMTDELDIGAMKSFLKSAILYPVDSIVELSNGEQAKVVENYTYALLRPKVVGVQSGKVYDLANDLECASIIIL